MCQSISSHRQRLENLFSKISEVSDFAAQSEWSKYLCILVSGFIEESLRTLLEEYTKKHSAPNIQNFVEKQLKTIINCNTNRIIEVLKKFSNDWAQEFEHQIKEKSSIDDSKIKNSIDSVIANRNSIAHGKNVGITYSRISVYYADVKKAVKTLEDIIK